MAKTFVSNIEPEDEFLVVTPGTTNVTVTDDEGFEAVYKIETGDIELATSIANTVVNGLHRYCGQSKIGNTRVQYNCIEALWLK